MTISVRWLVLALSFALAACRPLAPAEPPPPAPVVWQTGQFRAVLINGGGTKATNYQSHLLHVRGVVDLLITNGAPAEDIVIFSGDGSDPAADLATRERHGIRDFWLLPPATAHQLRPPIDYVDSTVDGFTLRPARKEALQAWFNEQAKVLGPGDTLLLYVTDHGLRNEQDLADNRIVLWSEELSVRELDALLGRLDPGVRVVMLMSQCFSGSFAHAMSSSDAAPPSGNVCGYFASTADRPAYGCYPENRGVDGVGHSHHFLLALGALGRMPEAGRRVLVTDDSPDVPNTTSDFFVARLIAREADRSGRTSDEVADECLARAWQTRGQWEPEIRLLDRIGATYGMFSPRSLAELSRQTEALPQVSEQLRTYGQRWTEALRALKVENFERFLTAHPAWKPRLDPKEIAALDPAARRQLAADLLAELVPFTEADRATWQRLQTLKDRADQAGAAAYRMEVRLGVVLRMRAVLTTIAGRVYLAERGTPDERQAFARLVACEDLNLVATPAVHSAAAMEPPERFPALADDRQVVQAVMPAWMGIHYSPLTETARQRDQRARGAVMVTSVYPGSAAAAAGLEVGDVILGPPGAHFVEPNQVREWTMRREIGESAPLDVARQAAVRRVTLRPEPYPMKMPELPGPPAVGSVAPPLRVEPFRGATDFAAAKPRLLFFWATWCAPCKFSLPEVMAFAAERHVEVVAVTDEDPEKLKTFFSQFKEPFPETVAVDPYRTTFQAYGVSGTPTFVLLDAAGVVRHYHTGYNATLGLGIEGWDYKARRVQAELKP